MIKKLFLIPVVIVFMLFNCILSAQAYINSQEDLHNTILKMYQLRSFDSLSFINKSELIGERLANFNEARFIYNSAIEAGLQQLLQFENELDTMNKVSNADPQFITLQQQRIYHDANAIVSQVDSQAGIFLQNIRYSMPTITYQKYRKKFYEYYESVELLK